MPERDRWPRYGLLLVSVVACVAILGAVPASPVQEVVSSALLGASLILAFRVARASRPMLVLAYAIAGMGVAVALARALGDQVGEGPARLVSASVVLLGPPAVAVGVVRNLRASGTVRLGAVLGVIALYMLAGMFFAYLYGALDRLGAGPFFAGGADATIARCIYYSFTTLATVGYGDFTARTDLGHTLSIFEALIGQIYLVTVVSLLVSNLGRSARTRPG